MNDNDIDDKFYYKHLLSAIGREFKDKSAYFQHMEQAGWIKGDLQGRYQVASILAIACAKDFNAFPSLVDKGIRVIIYRGKDKFDVAKDIEGRRGHLVVFKNLLKVVLGSISSKEVMLHGVRKTEYEFPEAALREFLANMIVHQDFTASGSRPIVEIFKDRIRMTNPGEPLIAVDRFIDSPSKTRNPIFAKLMRDAGLCEQRGSGVDRAIREIEKAALPPPLIETVEGATVVTIFGPRRFADMTPDERVRACFQHACLGYEHNALMSNASLRARFGLSEKQYPQVSNVIRDAIEAKRIKPHSADQANRNARYVPFYAEDM